MSKFIIGKDRNQTEFFCVEQLIDSNNIARTIDFFVDSPRYPKSSDLGQF